MIYIKVGRNGYVRLTSKDVRIFKALLRNIQEVPLPGAQKELILRIYSELGPVELGPAELGDSPEETS